MVIVFPPSDACITFPCNLSLPSLVTLNFSVPAGSALLTAAPPSQRLRTKSKSSVPDDASTSSVPIAIAWCWPAGASTENNMLAPNPTAAVPDVVAWINKNGNISS